MTAWMLNYLFYVGIILPTVVTLFLFVFFVICWRKQSARKAVLTKPYDPHGTMRRLGIPNRPPPPPVFIRRPLPSTSIMTLGGEDNAAYDMSRSPSAEAGAAAASSSSAVSGHHLQFMASPSGDLEYVGRHFQHLQASPCADLNVTGRLTFHSRLDSGLSEPACESPGEASVGGIVGGGGGDGGDIGEACGGSGSRERPHSQASHSSHSTDSEDSGFRSSRSGQLAQTGQYCASHEQSMLKNSRSAGRCKGRGCYQKAATSSPESDNEPCLQLTPTALWPHHAHLHHHYHSIQEPSALGGEETAVKTAGLGVNDLGVHLEWKYLQDLASPAHRAKGKAQVATASSPGHRQTLTCHQSMTLAQVHSAHDCDNAADVFGFSVV